MATARLPTLALTAFCALAGTGCLPRERIEPFPPMSMSAATGLVNSNIDRIPATLRAAGSVDGYVTLDDGRRRSFHLDGTMFYLAPSYLRFDLKRLGDTQLLFGSDLERYWFYSKEDGRYQCGRHGVEDDLSSDIPVKPSELMEALGLTPMQTGAGVQRIVDDYQQVLFLGWDDKRGTTRLEKEYWLDRYPPQLIGRVVFRDADGAVEMESWLDEYERLGSAGPWLPRVMVAEWPKAQARMRFRIRRWTVVPEVGPGGVQFAVPRECKGR